MHRWRYYYRRDIRRLEDGHTRGDRAGTDFGGYWGPTGHFRVAVVQVLNHNRARLLQKPHAESWVTVTRKAGKWEYDGFSYIDS